MTLSGPGLTEASAPVEPTHVPLEAAEPTRFVFVEGEPSTPALDAYFRALEFRPPEGVVCDISLELAPWVRSVAARLDRGRFLTIDYGGTAAELFNPAHRYGTLRGYRGHLAADPLHRPGEQDLTADVDFSTLIRSARHAGLDLEAFTTQRDFLLAMGWRRWLREGREGGRRTLTDLIDPRLMGRTRVLEMARS